LRNIIEILAISLRWCNGCRASLLIVHFYFDPENLKLTGIREGTGTRAHYSGLQIVDPRSSKEFRLIGRPEFSKIFIRLITEGRIGVVFYDGLWLEMGTLSEF
jgi:hypothetical protein